MATPNDDDADPDADGYVEDRYVDEAYVDAAFVDEPAVDEPQPAPLDAPTQYIPRITEEFEAEFTGGQVLHLPQRHMPTLYAVDTPPVGPPPLVAPLVPVPAKQQKRPPASGWRRSLHLATRGLINLGDSPADKRRRKLVDLAAAPIPGDNRIAVLSLKGGVGKTTTTIALGASLASARGDRIIAVDANPDFGTLAQRSSNARTSTVRELLADGSIARYSDLHSHTSRGSCGVEILASESDPAASEALTALDYTLLIDVLHRFYNIIITDCGTGLVDPVMRGVLSEANAVILVTSPAADSVRSTAATLDWIAHNRHPQLAKTATVVVSASRPGTSNRDVAAVVNYFRQRVSAVHFVPFDEHLAEGTEVALDRLKPAVRDAYLGLAASMVEVLRFQRG